MTRTPVFAWNISDIYTYQKTVDTTMFYFWAECRVAILAILYR